ncbi:MAG: DNA polymerase III subunit delta [Bacteroidales bacterium]|nr:DNA polymerase III subunit delta [Bacteroidales bacterium]
MYFRNIIGQKNIIEALLASVRQQKIPHAQLFSGTEGAGGLPLAYAYARYICCTSPGETDACGMCASCKKFDAYVHPDVHAIFPIHKPDSKKTWICDDFLKDWRNQLVESPYFSYANWMNRLRADNAQGMIYAEESDVIIRKLSLKSYESTHKIVIIWMPEKMNISCSNKLLKLLEEPPANTLFLLVSPQPDRLLSTILSRTQRIHIPGIDKASITTALQRQFNQSNAEEIDTCARLAKGSFTKAVECIQNAEASNPYLDPFVRIMRGAYTIANFSPEKRIEKQKALKEMKLWAEEMARMGREQEKQYLSYAQHMIRENYIRNINQPQLSYLNASEAVFSNKFFPFIHFNNIEGFMEELQLAERQIENNVNAKLVFFDLALQTILLLKK